MGTPEPKSRGGAGNRRGSLGYAITTFLEGLVVTQGQGAGSPLALFPWERKFLRRTFADGVNLAALSIARGNGKTGLVGAVAAAAVAGPLRQPRGEVVIVASSFSQARVAFSDVLAFLRPEIDANPGDWRVSDSSQRASIFCRRSGASVRAIGSDPRRAHGLRPVLALLDEPAQWPANTGDAMLAALVTSLGKVAQSRMVVIGTRPADSGHWFSRMLAGGADYAQVHAAPPDAPPYRLATWRRANPSMDFMPELRWAIAADARRAKADDTLLPAFRALRLNLGTADVSRPMLLAADTWAALESDLMPAAEGPLVYGVDLGAGAAMSSIAAYWPMVGRLEVVAAFPKVPDLEARGRKDNVGNLYRRMADRGELVLAGERVVDVAELLALATNQWGAPDVVVSDRYREKELLQELEASGLPGGALMLRGMGYKDGGQDVRAFRRAAVDGRFVTRRSLLMRAAISEAVVMVDPAGNAKLAKGHEGGRRLAAKDDAAAAAILAVAEGERIRAENERRPRRGVYLGLV